MARTKGIKKKSRRGIPPDNGKTSLDRGNKKKKKKKSKRTKPPAPPEEYTIKKHDPELIGQMIGDVDAALLEIGNRYGLKYTTGKGSLTYRTGIRMISDFVFEKPLSVPRHKQNHE